MSLPAPGLNIPVLAADCAWFNGLAIGAGTPFLPTKWEGLDKAAIRSGNTSRAQTRGSFIGVNLLDVRVITITMDVGPFAGNWGSYGSLSGALAALRNATSNEGTSEYPFSIMLPNQSQWTAMGRCTKKQIPWDLGADLGNIAQSIPIELTCTDPYFYSTPTQTPVVNLPAPGVGFSFPLAFNVSFGAPLMPRAITAVNSGNVPCFPVLLITGPCTNPSVTNLSIPGSPTLSFNLQMAPGDTLAIDADLQTVTYTSAGSMLGQDRLSTLLSGSQWFSMSAGTNQIAFNSQDTTQVAGTLSVQWASAVDSLT